MQSDRIGDVVLNSVQGFLLHREQIYLYFWYEDLNFHFIYLVYNTDSIPIPILIWLHHTFKRYNDGQLSYCKKKYEVQLKGPSDSKGSRIFFFFIFRRQKKDYPPP